MSPLLLRPPSQFSTTGLHLTNLEYSINGYSNNRQTKKQNKKVEHGEEGEEQQQQQHQQQVYRWTSIIYIYVAPTTNLRERKNKRRYYVEMCVYTYMYVSMYVHNLDTFCICNNKWCKKTKKQNWIHTNCACEWDNNIILKTQQQKRKEFENKNK